ncbi:MAG: DUF1565 domain-containing protein [Planctomycetes bacterium]|nr:DUF1565 domain-containing protein [Planctomycetota bacterium]
MRILTTLVLAAGLLLAGCGGGDGGSGPSIPAGGVITLTFVVTPSVVTQNVNTVVNFTVSGGTAPYADESVNGSQPSYGGTKTGGSLTFDINTGVGSYTIGAVGNVVDTLAFEDASNLSRTLTVTVPPISGTPVITSLEEDRGPEFAPVRIVGSDFGVVTGTVSFNSTSAAVIGWTDTEIVTRVPAGATTGNLTVTNATGTDSMTFTVTADNAYYVDDVNGNDTFAGNFGAPFKTIQQGVDTAQPGDWVVVRGGTYSENVRTQRSGSSATARITIAGYPTETALCNRVGGNWEIYHSWITLKDFEVNSQFGADDAVRGRDTFNVTYRRLEIYNVGSALTAGSTGDGIDITTGQNIVIEDCDIYDCLSGTFAIQRDSHAIVLGTRDNESITEIDIRRCNLYRISGDCIQIDPGRPANSVWNNLRVYDCNLYTEPMPFNRAGWNTGQTPGENVFDTKVQNGQTNNALSYFHFYRCKAHGFKNTNISNAAAFNIKENCSGLIEQCEIYDNEIGTRMRGPSGPVRIQNCVFYNNTSAIRYEDNVSGLTYYFCTFINSTSQHFQNGGGGGLGTGFQCNNCIFEGAIPSEATGANNLAITSGQFSSYFVNAAGNDYRLASGATGAIDQGVNVSGITVDFDGNARSNGAAPDIGAFER